MLVGIFRERLSLQTIHSLETLPEPTLFFAASTTNNTLIVFLSIAANIIYLVFCLKAPNYSIEHINIKGINIIVIYCGDLATSL